MPNLTPRIKENGEPEVQDQGRDAVVGELEFASFGFRGGL